MAAKVVNNTPKEGSITPETTSKKGTLHQGFTYTILIDAEAISKATFDAVTHQVQKHLPVFDKGLKRLTAHSTSLALRNTTYEHRTGDQAQALKKLREDLAKYRGAQTTFHSNYQALVVFTREIIVLVRGLKPSSDAIYTRATPSKQEMELVAQTRVLDNLKTSAYTRGKEGILVDVKALNKNMYGKLVEFDAQMQKLEKRGRDIEASQKSMLSMEYWWASPLKVEEAETDLPDVDETDYDKPDSYEESLRKVEASFTTPTPPPISNISELPPNLRSLVESENSSNIVPTPLKEETETPDLLPAASSSSLNPSTTSDALTSTSSSADSTNSDELLFEENSTTSPKSLPKSNSLGNDLTTDVLPSKPVNSSTLSATTPPPGLQSNKHSGISKNVVSSSTLPPGVEKDLFELPTVLTDLSDTEETEQDDSITRQRPVRNLSNSLKPEITVGRGSTNPTKQKPKDKSGK